MTKSAEAMERGTRSEVGGDQEGLRKLAPPVVDGVVVTFDRPEQLRTTIEAIAIQNLPLRRLWVIDNGDHPTETAEALRAVAGSVEVRHLPMGDNLGPAGGLAVGLEHVLAEQDLSDWVALFDDDDAPTSGRIVSDLVRTGNELLAAGEPVGGVGLRGGRMDWIRGRPVLPTAVGGLVEVDHLHGGYVPLYRTAALVDAPNFDAELFFGFEELAFGLALSSRGYRLFVDGRLWAKVKSSYPKAAPTSRPHALLTGSASRRYYAIRNLIWILRRHGHPVVALRIAAIRGILKPLVNLAIRPRGGLKHLQLGVRAVLDGHRGAMGRTVPLG